MFFKKVKIVEEDLMGGYKYVNVNNWYSYYYIIFYFWVLLLLLIDFYLVFEWFYLLVG